MVKGKIIFLNGVTSTGKTSISKTIQESADVNYYHLSNDIFQHMISTKFLWENYWKYLSESIVNMYYTAKGLAEKSINVIIDGMLFEIKEFKEQYGQSHYDIGNDITYININGKFKKEVSMKKILSSVISLSIIL